MIEAGDNLPDPAGGAAGHLPLTPPRGDSAGAMLRAAREAQGLHIGALATMLKVVPRKLEALEGDRFDEFQSATFVRALAQAASRALKIDPAPVLARLPEKDGGDLTQLEGGLNTPFRERDNRRESSDRPAGSGATLFVTAVLGLGALGFWLWPTSWRLPEFGNGGSAPDAANSVVVAQNAADVAASATGTLPAGSAVSDTSAPPAMPVAPGASAAAPLPTALPPALAGVAAPGSTAAPVPPAVFVAPAPEPALVAVQPGSVATATAASAVAVAPNGMLQLRARKPSWVEVVDAQQRVLLARTLAEGEAVGFDGALPMRVKIGNVAGTDISFRGQPMNVASLARDNVARVELK